LKTKALFLSAVCAGLALAAADACIAAPSAAIGPFDVRLIAGGVGITKDLPASTLPVEAGAPFSIVAWADGISAPGGVLLVALGDLAHPQARRLGLDGKRRPTFDVGGRQLVTARQALPDGGLHMVATTYDGQTVRLFVDGAEAGSHSEQLPTLPLAAAAVGGAGSPARLRVEIAPRPTDDGPNQHFSGVLRGVEIYGRALAPAELRAAATAPPAPPVIGYEQAAKPWPVQVRQQAGYDAPQPTDTLPTSAASYSAGRPRSPYSGPALVRVAAGRWMVAGGWRLASALDVGSAAEISRPGYDAARWLAATVPGTVLTTLVDRGIYPDPAYGLNNLAIPESLNKHDWWYRTEFDAPALPGDRRTQILFNGVNYASQVWLNGERLGTTTGAFIRGRFDVTGRLRARRNILSVRVSPPPHPGIPNEQSIKGGAGENGGMMMLDGPTFVATEGWDWIPGVRDRNTGIWQDVELRATGDVRLGDPRVVTTLPLPDRSRADVTITAELTNLSGTRIAGELTAAFDDVRIAKRVMLQPGANSVALTPAEYTALRVRNPKLWWPNGYGEPALHRLKLAFVTVAGVSDETTLRFGIREITYELSAFDGNGRLRRVEYDPAQAGGRRLIDGSHPGIHDAGKAFAVSLAPGAEGLPGLKLLPDDPLSPFLIVRVNGQRIAVRGGAWGMDDFMKRVSRARLEPYFRLSRDAHMNILRNWVGQDTEEALYDLADEYGILVWNDFWESTQDYNLEAQDPQLFLQNAADVVSRFRNHPSIMVWIGRNEGVPQPILNEGLERLTRELDGTRYYAGSSNRINLQNSGPYSYRPDEEYFTKLSKGYAVEVGLPSFSTLESFKASVPPSEQWPITDSWAYHDWHQAGNGDTHGFVAALTARFGAPTSLADFERKAQMMNYDGHRAVFEGMNAGLWRETSGRMLWMTQPAWPSNVWQLYSSDYDTHASYYGAKKAAEPVHIQLDRPHDTITVVNTTLAPLTGAKLRARVIALDGRVLVDRREAIDVAANSVRHADTLDLARWMAAGPVLVKLELGDALGRPLSDNFYWRAAADADLRRLNDFLPGVVALTAVSRGVDAEERIVEVELSDPGAAPVLAIKLTLQDAVGERVLPAYYDDNYVSLLPGERRTLRIRYPASGTAAAKVALRGWNAVPGQADIR